MTIRLPLGGPTGAARRRAGRRGVSEVRHPGGSGSGTPTRTCSRRVRLRRRARVRGRRGASLAAGPARTTPSTPGAASTPRRRILAWLSGAGRRADPRPRPHRRGPLHPDPDLRLRRGAARRRARPSSRRRGSAGRRARPGGGGPHRVAPREGVPSTSSGHTFGLLHCRDARCVMARSPSLRDVDAKSPALCHACRARLPRTPDRERRDP